MIKSFDQAVKFIERYIPTPDKKYPGELGLVRMRYLMELLGNPHLKYPTIHVGGTSGKGSTATIIASILATKYKVGLHTSPHLVRINERIKILSSDSSTIGGVMPLDSARGCHPRGVLRLSKPSFASPIYKLREISNSAFVDLLNKIIPVIKKMEKSEFGPPSYFEIIAAMAFLHFYMQKVDIAVFEVGMGGKYDATNVIKPEVAVITNVGLDHTEVLGDTVEKIAEDKAGIIKRGINVVTGVKQPSVIKIIKEACKRNAAALSFLYQIPPPRRSASHTLRGVLSVFSYRINKVNSEGSVFDYFGENTYRNFKLSLLGEYQVENAALAIRTVESLSSRAQSRDLSRMRDSLEQVERFLTSFGMTETDIRLGLKYAYIPGRLEIIRKKPLVILDGAHNPDKVKALVGSVKKIFPKKRITTIVAIKNDKNAREMLTQLLEISGRLIFTRFQLTADLGMINSYDPKRLLLTARNINIPHRYGYSHSKVENRMVEMMIIEDPKKAVTEAIELAGSNDLILATGSLYLVGEVKKYANIQTCLPARQVSK